MGKRYILCVLVLCLLLTGCSRSGQADPAQVDFTSSEPMPRYDAQNKYMLTGGFNFQEADGFYCGSNSGGSFLSYYDKASGISGVLCADPACTHDSPECGAYIHRNAVLSYYDGKLYRIIDGPRYGRDKCLIRSDLSGMNQEIIKRISFEDILVPYQPQRTFIHRGKLYLVGRSSEVVGAKTGFRVSLLCSPLDSSEEFTTLYDETYNCGIDPTVRFVGNDIYLALFSFTESKPYHLKILKYDATTGASETVFEDDNIPGSLGEFWVTDDGTIYLPGVDDTASYLWKLENGKRVQVATWPNSSIPDVTDGIAVNVTRENGIRLIDIKDFSGKTLYSGKMFPKEVPGLKGDPNKHLFAILGGDADKIIINLGSPASDENVIVMLDLHNNLEPTILWGEPN